MRTRRLTARVASATAKAPPFPFVGRDASDVIHDLAKSAKALTMDTVAEPPDGVRPAEAGGARNRRY